MYTHQLLENGGFYKVLAPQLVAVTFEGNCNLNCKHCFWAHNKRSSKALNWSCQIEQLISWNTNVAYAGRILSKKGSEFIREYCDKSRKKIGIVDNGYFILKYPSLFPLYRYVNISVDGVKKDHDTQRQRDGACEVAWETIFRLKEEGLKPIISSCISPINISRWKKFEEKVKKNDIRLVCTPVLGVKGNKNRMPLFNSSLEINKMFDILVGGCSKVIKLIDPNHVLALMPILKELLWEIKPSGYQAKINDVILFYQPLSIDTLTLRNLSWNGRFYINVDADNSRFKKEATTTRILKVANKFARKEHRIVAQLFQSTTRR